MTLGEIIKAYRDERGMSQRQFAVVCNLSNGYISMLESNKNPKTGIPVVTSLPTMKKIADVMGISVNVLLEQVDDTPIDMGEDYTAFPNILPVTTKKIPLLGEIACGEPIFACEDRESYIEAGTNIAADFCLRARGDSMINARILEGDIVFIRKQDMVQNGEIAAVIIDDEATLKRVYYYPQRKKLLLNAENPKYEPLMYVGEELDHIRILGKAVAFQSDVI